MAQQTPIVLGWLTAPGQLLNQAATQLTMTLNDATSLAQAARQHMRALPGGPGLVEVSYKWLMLLCAAACTPAAQSPALRAHEPLRGHFDLAWMQQTLQLLQDDGLFVAAITAYEEILSAVREWGTTHAVAFTAADWVSPGFAWVPGQLGGAAAQPWALGVSPIDSPSNFGSVK